MLISPPLARFCGLLAIINEAHLSLLVNKTRLASGDSRYYIRANQALFGCRAVSLSSVKSVQNHATLYPTALNTLYRLDKHAHVVRCHPTSLAEIWMLAYEVLQGTQIGASDKATREPAGAGSQIAQECPKHEGASEVSGRGHRTKRLPNNLFFEVGITL